MQEKKYVEKRYRLITGNEWHTITVKNAINSYISYCSFSKAGYQKILDYSKRVGIENVLFYSCTFLGNKKYLCLIKLESNLFSIYKEKLEKFISAIESLIPLNKKIKKEIYEILHIISADDLKIIPKENIEKIKNFILSNRFEQIFENYSIYYREFFWTLGKYFEKLQEGQVAFNIYKKLYKADSEFNETNALKIQKQNRDNIETDNSDRVKVCENIKRINNKIKAVNKKPAQKFPDSPYVTFKKIPDYYSSTVLKRSRYAPYQIQPYENPETKIKFN